MCVLNCAKNLPHVLAFSQTGNSAIYNVFSNLRQCVLSYYRFGTKFMRECKKLDLITFDYSPKCQQQSVEAGFIIRRRHKITPLHSAKKKCIICLTARWRTHSYWYYDIPIQMWANAKFKQFNFLTKIERIVWTFALLFQLIKFYLFIYLLYMFIKHYNTCNVFGLDVRPFSSAVSYKQIRIEVSKQIWGWIRRVAERSALVFSLLDVSRKNAEKHNLSILIFLKQWSFVTLAPKIFIPLYSELVRPHLQ